MTWHSGHVMSTAWHICRLLHTLCASLGCVCVPVFVCRICLGASQGACLVRAASKEGRPCDVARSGLLLPSTPPATHPQLLIEDVGYACVCIWVSHLVEDCFRGMTSRAIFSPCQPSIGATELVVTAVDDKPVATVSLDKQFSHCKSCFPDCHNT